MLLGYGVRLGAASRVFSAIGAIALGVQSRPVLTVAGIILHVVAVLACGGIYATLVGDARDHPVAWAIAIGGAAAGVAFLCARTFAGSIALVLTPGNLIAIGVVIAITLPVGMRFALSRV